jgi:hypothetical protein
MDFRSKVVSSSLTINVTLTAQATIQLEQTFTGMAQWQRARLITLRTQDRSLLPVFIIRAGLSEHATAVSTATLTPLAQRQSTQAHNLGVTRSKRVGGNSHSCVV